MDDTTKRDWKKKLVEEYEDEIEGAEKYLDLAKEAEEAECYITANAIELIAHEEFSHAKFLHGRLEEWGMLPREKEEAWEKLERKFGYR